MPATFPSRAPNGGPSCLPPPCAGGAFADCALARRGKLPPGRGSAYPRHMSGGVDEGAQGDRCDIRRAASVAMGTRCSQRRQMRCRRSDSNSLSPTTRSYQPLRLHVRRRNLRHGPRRISDGDFGKSSGICHGVSAPASRRPVEALNRRVRVIERMTAGSRFRPLEPESRTEPESATPRHSSEMGSHPAGC